MKMNSSSKTGVYNKINWHELVDSLSVNPGKEIVVDFDNWNLATPGYSEIYKLWKDADFNPDSIKWINYYPEKDFDPAIVYKLSDYLNLAGIHRAWISKINPGFFAPWHWDVDEDEEEYKKHGEIKRYSCFISGCSLGHIFILGDDYYYNQNPGTLVKWKKYNEWHAGINGGLIPKYMLHIIGY